MRDDAGKDQEVVDPQGLVERTRAEAATVRDIANGLRERRTSARVRAASARQHAEHARELLAKGEDEQREQEQ